MRVVFALAAVEQLDPLPDAVRRRVVKALRRLREWPAVSGVRALAGPGNPTVRTVRQIVRAIARAGRRSARR